MDKLDLDPYFSDCYLFTSYSGYAVWPTMRPEIHTLLKRDLNAHGPKGDILNAEGKNKLDGEEAKANLTDTDVRKY